MARRSSRLSRPSRRERRFWVRVLLLSAPLAAWGLAHAAGWPAPVSAYVAGVVTGLIIAPVIAGAFRRAVLWAHRSALTEPLPGQPARRKAQAPTTTTTTTRSNP